MHVKYLTCLFAVLSTQIFSFPELPESFWYLPKEEGPEIFDTKDGGRIQFQRSGQFCEFYLRIDNYLLLGVPRLAERDLKKALKQRPNDPELYKKGIEIYAALGNEKEMFAMWRKAEPKLSVLDRRRMLEEMAWGILKKGSASGQVGIRYATLIGMALSQDARALDTVLEALSSSNIQLRAIGIRVAAFLRDEVLQEAICSAMVKDPSWHVRQEAITMAGLLRMQQALPVLRQLLNDPFLDTMQRFVVISSIAQIMEEVSIEELKDLLASPVSGQRLLAAELLWRFSKQDAVDLLPEMLTDNAADVRMATLNVIALLRPETLRGKPVIEYCMALQQDANPHVAITASWVLLLLEHPGAQEDLRRFLQTENIEQRRFAAAAIVASGRYGTTLMESGLEDKDPYVRGTLAWGLLKQRKDIQNASDVLTSLLENNNERWMWKVEDNPLFVQFAPSTISQHEWIPNYPELMNQKVRLDLLYLLALVECPKAQDLTKILLRQRHGEIREMGMLLLLKEGDIGAVESVRVLIEDPDPKIRLQAALLLALWGKDSTIVPVLEAAYPLVERDQKIQILEALGMVGEASSLGFLVEKMQDPSQIVRIVAASSIIQNLNN